MNTEQATLETDTSRAVEADQSRLRQLFANLYRNAVEHGGDDVTVAVGAMDDGFYVADTGPGIPGSDSAGVFGAGYSINEDGTGFGLRIVEQIADAYGWEITVIESEQGGARFNPCRTQSRVSSGRVERGVELVSYLQAATEPVDNVRLMGCAGKDSQSTVLNWNDRLLCVVRCMATARTVESTGRTMGEEFRAILSSEATERPELLQMLITPDEGNRELVHEQERNALSPR